jgi:hypothetical protein
LTDIPTYAYRDKCGESLNPKFDSFQLMFTKGSPACVTESGTTPETLICAKAG